MAKTMLINMAENEECRVALLEGGRLEELRVERKSSESHWGNIYKGRVVNIEPSIQAAFVQIGEKERGFLHIADICPRSVGRGTGELGARRERRIQDLLSRGQEIVVQISRNGIGAKGPTLTTYVSIPGRFLVLMPQIKKSGVSRKIDDPAVRQELKQKLALLEPPEDMGVIIRTAGEDATQEDLRHDLDYLLQTWGRIEKKAASELAVTVLYEEGDLVHRTLRDLYSADLAEIVVDTEEAHRKAREFLEVVGPGEVGRVSLFDGAEPLFHRYRVEEQLEETYEKEVALPSGGYLVIEPTEALVAVDVNSGSSTSAKNIEDTALWTNLEAAREIGRQLRIRDLGGVVVIDFIDMMEETNRRRVEEAFRAELRKDRARTRMTRISQFGLVELTRQRLGPSVRSTTHDPCPSCGGKGWVKSLESVGLAIRRAVRRGVALESRTRRVEFRVHPGVERELQNFERLALARIEEEFGVSVIIVGKSELSYEDLDVRYFGAAGEPLQIQ